MSKKKAKKNKEEAPKVTRDEHILKKLSGGGSGSSDHPVSLRRLAAAILVLCAVLLLINVGIPALNEEFVWDAINMSSHLADGNEPRTVTNGSKGWLAFLPWKELSEGDYSVSVYYSADADSNYVEILTKDSVSGETITLYKGELSKEESVHEFPVSLNVKGDNFYFRIRYGGEGTLTFDKVVIKSVRRDLAVVQYALDIAVLFTVAGYCISKLRKAEGEAELLPWKKRVKKALPVALLLSVTFCVAGPVNLYVTNTSEFWFSLGQMMPMVIICFTAVTVLGTTLLSVMPKKAFYWVLAAVFGLGVALYVEGNFLIQNLGQIDGSNIAWNDYSTWAIWDTLIILAIILIPIVLVYYRLGFVKKMVTFVSLFLVFTQLLATGISVVTADDLDGQGNSLLTTSHFTELSKDDNIFVIIADTLDAEYTRELLESEPAYAESLRDFIWYRNAACTGASTAYSMPAIFTGVRELRELDRNSFMELADQYTPLYKALYEKGYDIGMYTGTGYVKPNQYISNAYLGTPYINSQGKFISAWMRLTAFRCFPQILKGLVSIGYAEFDELKAGPDGAENYVPGINTENSYYHRPLNADNEKKTFHVYHFPGLHAGHYLNEDGWVNENVETDVQQRTKGCFSILLNFVEQMKELGVYDNSTIIFMADHGVRDHSRINPTFMIKPKGYTGAFGVSDAPISYDDLIPTFLDLIGEDGSKYGRTIFEIGEDEERERVCWIGMSDEDGEWRCIKHTGTEQAKDYSLWEKEGSSQYSTDTPINPIQLSETIENVEKYNTICARTINEVRCDFASPPVGDVQMNMTLYTLIEDPSHLVVTANGEEVFNDAFVSGERSFTIPDELVDDSVTLQFTFPEATDKSAYLIAYDFAGTEMGE